MKTRSGSGRNGRREFLVKGMAAVGGAAVVAMAGGRKRASVEESPATTSPAAESQGYRMTPHIREYYEKARF